MNTLGRYEVHELLGSGGAGRVHAATLIGPGGLRKPVALKVLTDGSEELRREARIGGLLRHENLVDVYEISEEEGQWFCAMERCSGTLAGRPPLSLAALVEVGLAVCAALTYAHEELGLVHLDLKPQNLLFSADGTVKVADLGIARAKGFEQDARVRGTLGFMAPEQMRGEPVDARTDVFALGVTLTALATGTGRATETMSFDELDLPEPSTTRQIEPFDIEEPIGAYGGPAALEPVIERCTAISADRRYPSMAALAEALRAIAVDGPDLRQALGIAPAVRRHADVGDGLTDDGDAFVGRAETLRQLESLLTQPGVVSLRGPAGIGKSRLGRAAAGRWKTRALGFLQFCDLTEVRGASGLQGAVAAALGVSLGRSDPDGVLGSALAARGPALLVLDNADQLVEHLGQLAAWCAAAPELRVLLTSRNAVRLGAELVVEPLDLEGSLALLVARARDRGADVEGDPDLTALAERLDGLPLALELAAGRLGVLSVADVLVRLESGVLRTGRDERHGTLERALSLSWNWLDIDARRTLAQLSVFSGGFAVEDAEAVVDLSGRSVLDPLSHLVDASMIQDQGQGRFGLLSSVRVFAQERLEDAEVRRRHAEHFARFGRAMQRAAERAPSLPPNEDSDNFIAGCWWAIDAGEPALASELLSAAWHLLDMRGPADVACELVDAVRSMPLSPLHALSVAGVGAQAWGNVGAFETAIQRAQEALEAGQLEGTAHGMGWGHCILATALSRGGRAPEAEEHLDRAMELLATPPGHYQLGFLHGLRGERAIHRGDMPAAIAHLEKAIELVRLAGPDRMVPVLLMNLAIAEHDAGQDDASLAHYTEALDGHRALGNRRFVGLTLGNLAALYSSQGRHDLVGPLLEEALQIHEELGNRRGACITGGNLAQHCESLGDLEAARAGYRKAVDAAVALKAGRLEGHWRSRLGWAWREDLDVAETEFERATALLEDSGDRALLSLCLCLRSQAFASHGDLVGARSWLEEARRVAPAGNALAQRAIDEAVDTLERGESAQ